MRITAHIISMEVLALNRVDMVLHMRPIILAVVPMGTTVDLRINQAIILVLQVIRAMIVPRILILAMDASEMKRNRPKYIGVTKSWMVPFLKVNPTKCRMTIVLCLIVLCLMTHYMFAML